MRRLFLLTIAATILVTSCAAQGEARVIRRTSRSSSSVSSSSARSSSLAQSSSSAKTLSSLPIPVPSPIPSPKRIPILVYHHIRKNEGWPKDSWSTKMSVSPEVFEKQLQWIDDHGYTTIDLSTFAAIMKGERSGPEKPVVLTFDDNNLSQYDIAFPSLLKHGQIGVFYLIANKMDAGTVVNRQRAREMSDKGMAIESHTMTHAGLTNLSPEKLDWELRESRKVLAEVTGKPVLHLAYPLTMHNQKVRDAAASAGYVTATIMDPRPATGKDSLWKLPRIMMEDGTRLDKVLP